MGAFAPAANVPFQQKTGGFEMAMTLQEHESVPDAYPTAESDALWQRIEAYCRERWTARDVTWMVEGPGEWCPPLMPAVLREVQIWDGSGWTDCDPPASPWGGYELPAKGPYRIVAGVGGGDAPKGVLEAFRRLLEYSTGGKKIVTQPGASSYKHSIGGNLTWEIKRDPAWMAKALQNSGAADLLRPYRRG